MKAAINNTKENKIRELGNWLIANPSHPDYYNIFQKRAKLILNQA